MSYVAAIEQHAVLAYELQGQIVAFGHVSVETARNRVTPGAEGSSTCADDWDWSAPERATHRASEP